MRRSFLTAAAIAGLPLGLGAAQLAAAQTMPPASTTTTTTTTPSTAPATTPGSGWHSGRHSGIGMMKAMQARFVAANTSHDGHLTLAQAKAADLRIVAANFSVIDTGKRGYVTFNDIMAWRLDRIAQRLQSRAAALRAQD